MLDTSKRDGLTNRRSFIKNLGLLGGTGAVSSLAGCTSLDSDGQSLLLGSVYQSGHVINEMAAEWADLVREETDSRVNITIDEGFGGEREVMEQTSIGAIEGTLIGATWVLQQAPSRYWVESPFVFDSWEQQRRAYTSDYLDEARENLKSEANQRIVGPPIYRGFRHTTGNQGFQTPSDIEGSNIRIPEVDPWLEVWKGIGAAPTTVAFDELYSSLQQGVVGAQENPAETINSYSIYEVQSHITKTSHQASTGWFTFSEDAWSSMSDDDQQLVEETLTGSIEELSADIEQSESKALDELEDEGMEIVEPDRDAWLSAAEPILEELFENQWDPSLEEVRDI
ncbi:TRAP transporter substrate-binding protein [Natrinema sp. SYSU A 869]|uniref:TRAP transporter substrate-binding protein n=1 Tax=Natrinema sp. SYSU A 869 TaxID=2871694 RepID=UPI002106F5E1|nr:TRAP transporter substrate-binding protein [Natrinema sp. SYSU A 869]